MLLVMSYTKKSNAYQNCPINAFNWMYAMLQVGHRQFEERNAVMLEYMKKDVASMSGRLLNRWEN